MELHTQYAPVPALSRAALVLKAVFENGGLPAKDIARRCPCPKTTFYRLLAELVHSGYLYEDEQTKLYTPGPLFEQGFAGREEQQARMKELAGPCAGAACTAKRADGEAEHRLRTGLLRGGAGPGPAENTHHSGRGHALPFCTRAQRASCCWLIRGRRLSTAILKRRPSSARRLPLRMRRAFRTLRGTSAARAMHSTQASLSRRWGLLPARCAARATG